MPMMSVGAQASTSTRLLSLDTYRGLTVMGMILVTDPGTYNAVYAPLLHATWVGATPTDMIFPSFLFIVGMSITLSFASRIDRGATRTRLALHTLRRTLLLLLLGLLVNGFPYYHLSSMRLPGILQRIALCYFFSAMLYLVIWKRESQNVPQKEKLPWIFGGVFIAILAGYWLLLLYTPVPGIGAGHLDSYGNFPAYIDRMVFGIPHLWAYGLTPGRGVTYDPEGILSTFPAMCSTLAGIMAGWWLRTRASESRKVLVLAIAGIMLACLGWILSVWMPLNKRIWTPTFALLSIGVSLVAFSLLYWLIDLRRWQSWIEPARIFGSNAILAFVVSGCLTTLADLIEIPDGGKAQISLHTWTYIHVFTTWLSPIHASLLYAVSVVLINLALLYPLYRAHIVVRV
jgi:predicted acyltransferase